MTGRYTRQFHFTGLLLLLTTVTPYMSKAQTTVFWTGLGNDQQWNNPANWDVLRIPASGDTVLLNNSVVDSSYEVRLPEGGISVAIVQLQIKPDHSNIVRLVIPVSNIANPALSLSSSGVSILLASGAMLINESGAASGNSIQLSGRFRIEDGAHYVHRTRRAHATLVAQLSHDSGTTKGIFEFDVPMASSTISVSDRRYGTLILSSDAMAGSVVYTAAGTRAIHILGDLILRPGVQLKMNSSDTMHIGGGLFQYGALLDLSTTSRKLVMAIEKNIFLDTGGQITESGTSQPLIILSGKAEQRVEMRGMLKNQVSLELNNAAGARLVAPLYLPYHFILSRGVLFADSSNLLSLSPDAEIVADINRHAAYIDGPVRKEGLNFSQRFVFPLGAGGILRWLAIDNFAGDITMMYHRRASPAANGLADGLARISSVGNWSAHVPGGGIHSARVELSFHDGNSSGVTDMATLAVASLVDSIWHSAGNSFTSGSPGSSGSVRSEVLNLSWQNLAFFTLGATNHYYNPLPLRLKLFRHQQKDGEIRFEWQLLELAKTGQFHIHRSIDNVDYTCWQFVSAGEGLDYTSPYYPEPVFNIGLGSPKTVYYKLIYDGGNGEQELATLPVRNIAREGELQVQRASGIPGTGLLELRILSPESTRMQFYAVSGAGRNIPLAAHNLRRGKNEFVLPISNLPVGFYHIFGISSKFRTRPKGFLRL